MYCPISCRMAIQLLSGLLSNFYWFCYMSSIGSTAPSDFFWNDHHCLSDPPLNHYQSPRLISNSHLYDLNKNNCSTSTLHEICNLISFSSAAWVLSGPQLHLHLISQIYLPVPIKPIAWFLLAPLPFPLNPPPSNVFQENHTISVRDWTSNIYLLHRHIFLNLFPISFWLYIWIWVRFTSKFLGETLANALWNIVWFLSERYITFFCHCLISVYYKISSFSTCSII